MLTQRIYDDRPTRGQNEQNWVLPNGTTLGQYTIINTLREDNSSITYLAKNTFLDYEVELREHLPKMFATRDNYTFEVIPSAGNELNYQESLTRFSNDVSALARQQQPNVAEVLAFFSALGTTYSVSPHYTDRLLTQAAPPPSDISENWLAPVLISLLNTLHNLNKIGIGHSNINGKSVLITETGAPILTNIAISGADNKEGNEIPALGELCYRLIRGESSGVMGGLYSYKPLSSDSSLIGRFTPSFLKSIDKALAPYSDRRWKSVEEWLAELENTVPTGTSESSKCPGVTVVDGKVPIITVTLQDNDGEPLIHENNVPISDAGDMPMIPIDRKSEATPSEILPNTSEAEVSVDMPETCINTELPEASEAELSVDMPETCINTELPEASEAEDSVDMPETCINTELPEIPVEKLNEDLPETIISDELPEIPVEKLYGDLPETFISDKLPEIPVESLNEDLPETIISDKLPEIPVESLNEDLPETIISDKLPEIPVENINADLPETGIGDKLPEIPIENRIEDKSATSSSTENLPSLSGLHQNQHIDVKELSFTHIPIDEDMPPIIPMPPPTSEDDEDITLTPPPGQADSPIPQPKKTDYEYPKITVEEFGIAPVPTPQKASHENQASAPKPGVKVTIEDIGISTPIIQPVYNPRPADLSSDSVIKVDDLPIGTANLAQPQTPIPCISPTPKKKKGCLNLFLLLILLLLIALGVIYFVKGSEFIIEQINYLRSELETMLHG